MNEPQMYENKINGNKEVSVPGALTKEINREATIKKFGGEVLERLTLVFTDLPNLVDRELKKGTANEWPQCFITQSNVVMPDFDFLKTEFPRTSPEDQNLCKSYDQDLRDLLDKAQKASTGVIVLDKPTQDEMLNGLSSVAGGIADMFRESILQ